MPIAVTGLLLLFASVIQIEAVDLKCAEIANKTYQIAFYFSGHFFKENFTGTPIDLGRLYNIRLREAKGTFSVQAARLLLGYDGEVIALPYSVGKVEIEKRKENSRATFSPASSDLKVKIEKWFRANRNEVKLTSGGNNVDFGTLDPASVTLFHDIIFTGDRNIDTTTGKEAENMNLRIKYVTTSIYLMRLQLLEKADRRRSSELSMGTKFIEKSAIGNLVYFTKIPSFYVCVAKQIVFPWSKLKVF
ncbi:hypothetical protein L596_016943 [Steinernema carpocapsae]|uniref:Lipid-binding serum glycoprotein N-terminal domain-containing protein n=1 Tax=Steinernema carpocapsae TaxID=34508 RepID=A0A4U5MZV0_STECR|nr:hypothetical protein L596_016943 [Steinernema carpocapsae]